MCGLDYVSRMLEIRVLIIVNILRMRMKLFVRYMFCIFSVVSSNGFVVGMFNIIVVIILFENSVGKV